jgi:hypothetical protein
MTNDSLISLTKMTLAQQETIEEYKLRLDSLSRRFPMLDGPDIDWVTAEKIYVLYKALYTNEQTLERIAERGGFGWDEVKLMVKKAKKWGGKSE